MCGVTGFWLKRPVGAEEGCRLATRMSDAIAHRGPDGFGAWYVPSDGVGLGHRRLSIIDLSEAGRQPMASASGRYTVSFNGEIFNFEDLRRRLDSAGRAPAWRGHSDTEVMLAAFDAWGIQASVQQFIGMFAFAVWDAKDKVLTLGRDRLGIKPMYWARTAAGICFGSELKSLRLFPDFRTEIDRTVLAAYLQSYCIPSPHSIYRDAFRLKPGTLLEFRADQSREPVEVRYWSAAEIANRGLTNPFEGSEAEAVEHLDALLRDAVRLRMVSDVPIGAFLSGGIDSSTVVALMQAQARGPVHTFSIANELKAYDEGHAAQAVANHLQTNHTALTVTAREAVETIPLLPQMYDEPFADSSQIPTYLVSRLARRHVTVALSGDGGDELFGGYNRHVWSPRLWSLLRAIPRGARRRLGEAIAGVPPDRWDALWATLQPALPRLRLPGLKAHKLASIMRLSSPDAIYETLSAHWQPGEGALVGNPEAAVAGVEATPPTDVSGQMMFRDLVLYLPDDILTKVDRASMAVSLEARVPLLDHRVVEFAWTLPMRLKVRGNSGKWILRKVLERYVPGRLTAGAKMGFGVPMADWLRGPLRAWAEELLEPGRLRREGYFNVEVVQGRWRSFLAGERPWEHHIWDVLMFQAWHEGASEVRVPQHGESRPVSAVQGGPA